MRGAQRGKASQEQPRNLRHLSRNPGERYYLVKQSRAGLLAYLHPSVPAFPGEPSGVWYGRQAYSSGGCAGLSGCGQTTQSHRLPVSPRPRLRAAAPELGAHHSRRGGGWQPRAQGGVDRWTSLGAILNYLNGMARPCLLGALPVVSLRSRKWRGAGRWVAGYAFCRAQCKKILAGTGFGAEKHFHSGAVCCYASRELFVTGLSLRPSGGQLYSRRGADRDEGSSSRSGKQ